MFWRGSIPPRSEKNQPQLVNAYMDKGKFNVLFSSVISNDGEVADNPMLRSVAKILSKGVLGS